MRLLYALLYSLIFSYSSLFAYTAGTYEPNSWAYSTVEACEEAALTTSDNYFTYMSLHSPYCNNTMLTMVYTCDEGHYSNTEFQYVDVGPRGCEYSSPICTAPQILNDYGDSCINPVPTCNPETEYLNEINECVLLTSGIPLDFPDNNTSNGVTSIGSVPTTEQGCIDMERYNSSLGIVEVIGWDYGTQACKVVAFKCNQGRVFEQSTNKCIVPPDNTSFGSDSGCVNDNWAMRWTHDFCGDCVGQAGIWLPPLGHEESGMECNKAYLEYQCVKDYRIKKYVEVSCGDPIPIDSETNEINMDNLSPTVTVDQNLSDLPTIDPTQANLSTIEGLRAIETAIKENLSPKIDTVNDNLLIANNKLSDIDNKLFSSNTKLDDINTNLDNINGVLNTTGDGIDPSNMDIDVTPLDDTNSIMDNLTDNVKELTDGVTSIQTQFTETKALLSGEQPVINIGRGSCTDENLAKFAGYISPYSSIFSLVVYVGFMVSIFKMIFAYFARGE